MLHWDDKHLTFTQMILKLILQIKKYKLEVMKTVMGKQNTVIGNINSQWYCNNDMVSGEY